MASTWWNRTGKILSGKLPPAVSLPENHKGYDVKMSSASSTLDVTSILEKRKEQEAKSSGNGVAPIGTPFNFTMDEVVDHAQITTDQLGDLIAENVASNDDLLVPRRSKRPWLFFAGSFALVLTCFVLFMVFIDSSANLLFKSQQDADPIIKEENLKPASGVIENNDELKQSDNDVIEDLDKNFIPLDNDDSNNLINLLGQ